jgi:hypothetical protein
MAQLKRTTEIMVVEQKCRVTPLHGSTAETVYPGDIIEVTVEDAKLLRGMKRASVYEGPAKPGENINGDAGKKGKGKGKGKAKPDTEESK